MRYPVIILALLISLVSCKSSLIISDVQTENIQNEPALYSPDASIISLVGPYQEKLEKDMSGIVAFSAEELIKAKPESKLTNLVADLLMQAGKPFLEKKNTSPDMAYVNYGGLRASLPKGEITVRNIFELMPFENELVLLKLSGATLEKFIGRIAERGGDGVSGITLGIKNGAIGSLKVGGEQLDKHRDYWLVTNDYIANGGDDMAVLSECREIIHTGYKLRDLIIDYLKADYEEGKEIQVQTDGRIYHE